MAGWGAVTDVELEVRGGIEPPYADLQSAASPLCHRTVAAAGISALPHGRSSARYPRRCPELAQSAVPQYEGAPPKAGPRMDLAAPDFAGARNQMIDGQTWPNRVSDPRIPAAMHARTHQREEARAEAESLETVPYAC